MDSAANAEKCVYLLVGQRGAGKSYYAQRLIENQPEFFILSRDEILVRQFGSADVDPYSGGQEYARVVLEELTRFAFKIQKNIGLILDTWTENSSERKSLLEKLRELGATRIVALYFATPLELVNVWFWEKPGIADIEKMSARRGEGLVFFSKDDVKRDYALFHRLARGIDSDGFDAVIRVDPRDELITLS